MHILIVAKKPPVPAHDGEGIAIRQMIKGLCAAGNEVFLMYLNTEKHHTPQQTVANDLQIPVFAIEAQTRATRFGALRNLMSDLPYHVERFAIPELSAAIYTHLQQHPDTIVQCEGLYTLLSAYIALRGRHTGENKVTYFIPKVDPDATSHLLPQPKKGEPLLVYRSHNVEHEIWNDLAAQATGLKKRYFRIQSKRLEDYEKHIIRETQAIIPISRTDAQWYAQQHVPRPLCYIPSGIDVRATPDVAVDTRSLYFIGGMDWLPNREGLKWFIDRVWPKVKSTCPAVRLEFAGRNAPGDMAANLPKDVHFHGEVPDADVFAADKLICIVPLLSGSGMKIKVVDAMAAGKAVVTTSKGAAGMPEGLQAHLIIADTPEDFAQAVSELLDHPERALALGREARAFVRTHLDTPQLGMQLTRFYQTLLPQ